MSRRKNKDFSIFIYIILIVVISLKLFDYISNNLWILFIPIPIIAIIIYYNYTRKIELVKNLQTVDSLLEHFNNNPYGFERYIANLYSLLGYKTQVTAKTNDGGKDIIMWKNDNKYVVEVKLYSEKNLIDRPKIQKLHSAMIDCEASDAIFVTTSRFTKSAQLYADKFNIQTLDGMELAKLIDRVNRQFNYHDSNKS